MESRTASLKPHTDFLWARADYEDLVEKGIFTPADKVELLNGKILTMSPPNVTHATSLRLVLKYLQSVFQDSKAIVNIQLPLALDDLSEPEPDIAVVHGEIRDFTDHHPTAADALIVVEISGTSLDFDRGDKLKAYARAGIPEYWIVNLVGGVLEVHRSPSGQLYESVRTLGSEASVAPLGREKAATKVAELLP